MKPLMEPLETDDALALLETAMECFRRGKRAEARDLFLGVNQATEGDIARFATDAARFLEADGGFLNGEAMETAFAALTASFPA